MGGGRLPAELHSDYLEGATDMMLVMKKILCDGIAVCRSVMEGSDRPPNELMDRISVWFHRECGRSHQVVVSLLSSVVKIRMRRRSRCC